MCIRDRVTPAHIKKLNSIGMVWDARDAKWGTAYQQAKAYYKAHGLSLIHI